MEILSVKHEHGVTTLQGLRPGYAAALFVGAAIPDDHRAGAGPPFEVVVANAVVLHLDRQALDRRVHRRTLGHGPRTHHPINLQTDIEMVGSGLVLLHNEHAGRDAADSELFVPLDLARRI